MKSTINVVDRILTVKVTIKSLFSNSLVRDESECSGGWVSRGMGVPVTAASLPNVAGSGASLG